MALFKSEVWITIENHPMYMVSTYGRVRSLDRHVSGKLGSFRLQKGKILSPYKNKDGYLVVDLNDKQYRVHRLVAEAFLGKSDVDMEVNHKDRCRQNNNVDNLEWVTLQENQEHSWLNGRIGSMNGRFGFDHNKSHAVIRIFDGIVVDVFGSIKEAARELGVADCIIGQAIKNRGGEIRKRSHKLYGSIFQKVITNAAI